MPLSGLQGKAFAIPAVGQLPSKAEVLAAIPEHCFKRDTAKSMGYAAVSLAITLGTGVAAALLIPLKAAYLPLWLAYAVVNGTNATGMWVVAHECGHNAFSDDRTLQDAVGYAFHSALLVPYFSWQRSHAVHHSRTNHVTEGETHCPYPTDSKIGKMNLDLKAKIGEPLFIALQVASRTCPFCSCCPPARSSQPRRARRAPPPRPGCGSQRHLSLALRSSSRIWLRAGLPTCCGAPPAAPLAA